jgi:hypothetical protein
MLEETTPYTSSKWVPHSTFAADMGMIEKTTPEEGEKDGHVEAAAPTDNNV